MVLFIENVYYLEREGALDHRACTQSQCTRSLVTAYKTHSTTMKAMEARATRVSRVYVDVLDCQSVL